jgi:[protein-PII] uridylyltransferase
MAGNEPKVFDASRFDAALRTLPGDAPGPVLALFRGALRDGRAGLQAAWQAGAPADPLLHRHAVLVDALLMRAWALHRPLLPADLNIALVAVGGYGRGELYPHSDVDLLLLLKRDDPQRVQPFAEAFLRFLWDLGLEVGHSVRSLADCVAEAKKDITVATNLMEARLLVGDPALFAAMQAKTGPKKLWPSRRFFAAKLAEQRERHQHFDDTAYNLEPNLKEGPGGLRDIQIIAWVTQREFGTTRLHDLVAHGFLSEKEYRALERGRRLLAQLRCGLHYLAERREDRLLFDQQRVLAAHMGFRDKRGIRGVELFMKRYYRTVKELALLNEILLQHFQEAILQRGRARVRPINRRFQAHGAFLEVTRRNVFERFPLALLELFLVMQQNPQLKGVRAATIRLLRENLHRIDTQFRNSLACRALFMEILRQPRGITHELRRMNAYGVLGALLPAFGRVVGQMQHDLFHVYTVDQHTLFVVRNLRRFTVPEHRDEFPFASRLIQHVAKPERLYLAGLFHDIAKGRGGDHSELGEHEVIAFCRRHNLSDYDTRFVAWLVRQHLLMSHVAQREDIHDPEVVLRFARRVGDAERLDHLYLLTVADMRATSPKVWNVWKDRLLTQLHAETLRVLRRGLAAPMDVEARLASLKAEAWPLLDQQGIARDAVEQHWARMDTDYFLRHDAAAIAWHTAEIVRTAASALPLVVTRFHPDAGGTEFLIYTPDRDELFAILTGGFDRLNLTIMDARIHTTRFGFALDTFVVLDHAMQPVTDGATLAELAQALRGQLLAPQPGRDFLQAALPRTLKHFPIETRVGFSPSASGQQTILEVTAQDRPGLLYQVALALQHCKARLVTAKVATYGERAEDYFFITDRDGRAVTDPSQQECLEREILARLGGNTPAEAVADIVTGPITF